ncbi:MAG: ribulose-phosphate 3-epimerase, partial [bacterium]
VDIMDGHYVDNLTFGPQMIKNIRNLTNLPIEVHLELFNPEKYILNFVDVGADIITLQLDTCIHPIRILKQIKGYNRKAGIAINPTKNIEDIRYLVNYIDYVLLMSVEPGFGGQKFEEIVFEKIKKIKDMFSDLKIKIPIGVDGGINLENSQKLKEQGVEILVIGSALFQSNDLVGTIYNFKN